MKAHLAGPRQAFAAAPIVFLLAGCVASSASMAPPSPVAASPAASSAASSAAASLGDLPDVARIQCGSDPLTTVAAPVVRPRADGVHIETTNTTGTDRTIDIEDVGGGNAPSGVSTTVWAIAPGTVRVRCFDPRLDAGSDAGWAVVTVVDQDDLYRPTALQCSGDANVETMDYVEGAKGEVGDPVALTRASLSGLRPSDAVEAGGYPKTAERVVRIVRDGQVLGTISWSPAGDGGWLRVTDTFCNGSGLGS